VASAEAAKEVVGTALSVASVLVMQQNRPFSVASHLITSITTVDADGVALSIDFVELADLLCFTGVDVDANEMKQSSRRHKSLKALRDFRGHFPHRSSALGFYLHESLAKVRFINKLIFNHLTIISFRIQVVLSFHV